MFSVGLGNLDPQYNTDITEAQKTALQALFAPLDASDKERVLKVAKGMILRQLVGSTNENIGKSPLGMSMEYSDVLHNDEELDEKFLAGLNADAGLVLSNLPSIVQILTQ
jgi:hypothetical protein